MLVFTERLSVCIYIYNKYEQLKRNLLSILLGEKIGTK